MRQGKDFKERKMWWLGGKRRNEESELKSTASLTERLGDGYNTAFFIAWLDVIMRCALFTPRYSLVYYTITSSHYPISPSRTNKMIHVIETTAEISAITTM
jgi:hypothetical protein